MYKSLSLIYCLRNVTHLIKIYPQMKWAYAQSDIQEIACLRQIYNSTQEICTIYTKFLWIFLRRAQIQVAVAARVARLIAALHTARAVNMVATISNLSISSSNNNRRTIRRRSSAVRVSVKSVSVIGRGTTRTESPATIRGSPREQADRRGTVVTSVTSGANRTPMRRRQNT